MRTRWVPVLAILGAALLGCSSEGDVFALEVGTCFDDFGEGAEISNVPIVDCAEPHQYEVYALFDLADGEFPGTEAVGAASQEGCIGSRFEDYVGAPYATSAIYASAFEPTAESWAEGDREVVCFLYEPDVQLTGSMRGAGR